MTPQHTVEILQPPGPSSSRADGGKVADPAAFIDAKLQGMHALLEGDVMAIPRDPDVAGLYTLHPV
jgi:hypothetical protein